MRPALRHPVSQFVHPHTTALLDDLAVDPGGVFQFLCGISFHGDAKGDLQLQVLDVYRSTPGRRRDDAARLELGRLEKGRHLMSRLRTLGALHNQRRAFSVRQSDPDASDLADGNRQTSFAFHDNADSAHVCGAEDENRFIRKIGVRIDEGDSSLSEVKRTVRIVLGLEVLHGDAGSENRRLIQSQSPLSNVQDSVKQSPGLSEHPTCFSHPTKKTSLTSPELSESAVCTGWRLTLSPGAHPSPVDGPPKK